jgi:membrane fusion protein (multidrug efflux system)
MIKLKKFVARKWKLLLVLLIAAGGILFFASRNNDKNLQTTEVQKGTVAEELFLSGFVTAKNYAKLSFETPGKIVYVGVSEGDKVVRGRLLSKLDTTVLNANYQVALSNLRAAQATVDNIHDQVKDHSGDETFAQKDLRTTAEVNKDKAYEAVIAAKRNLDGGSLYAPFNGIVTYLAHPFTGVYTSPTSHEVEIIDPETIYFEVLADQNEVGNVVDGQKVEIILDSFDDKRYSGVVDYVSYAPKVGEANIAYKIIVKFVSLDLKSVPFKIGMTGDAKFILKEKTESLFVPSNFVNSDIEGKYVKSDNKGTKIYVQTGLESEENTEIMGEISQGQVIYD